MRRKYRATKNAAYAAGALLLLAGIPCAAQVVNLRLEVVPAEAQNTNGVAVAKAAGEKVEKPEPAKPEPKKKAKEGFQAVQEKKGAPARRIVVAPLGPAVAPRQGVLAIAAQNDAMLKQWQQQLRPLLVAELNFVRHVCDLSEEQRPKIRAAGEKGLQEAAAEFVKTQQGRRPSQLVDPPSSSTFIQRNVSEALEATLLPEQYARYKAEFDARTAQRKRATILSVVSRLEEALSLSVEQREKLMAELSTNWREEWEQWLVVSRYGEQYFPQIPNRVLYPHLEQTQRSLWDELPKIASGSFVGLMGQPVDDVAWWGAVPAAPPVAPPDAVNAAAVDAPAAEAKGEVEAEAPAALGQVFLKVISDLFSGGQK
jgi:hypothetical protein